MRRVIIRSIALTLAVKALAVGAFLAFWRLFPINFTFTTYAWPSLFGASLKLPHWITLWANFDGSNYLSIAISGTSRSQVAFFPLYPWLIRHTRILEIPHIIHAQGISLLAFAAGLTVLFLLLKKDALSRLTTLVSISILLFPTSYSYTAVYNDSVFFFFATLTLWLGRSRLWFFASVTGALATLTRLNGLALFPYLLVEYARLPDSKKNLRSLLSTLLIPGALLGYLGFLHTTYGSWYVLFESMRLWGQHRLIIPLQTIYRYAKIFYSVSPSHTSYWVAVFEIAMWSVYLYFIWWSFRKIRLSYWVFFLVSIAIPSLTGTFQGMPRYALHLYPFFLSLALWLDAHPKLIRLAVFVVLFILYLISVTLFTHGIFIA